MTELVRYEAMVTAIANCEAVDEVKDIRDKAVALEAYYRQARNMEAERKACNVRLRAERRFGELLKELARKPGARNDLTSSTDTTKSEYGKALEHNGISRDQASRFQAMANVPKEKFEEALSEPGKPTQAKIIASLKQGPAKPKVEDDALWLWGRLRDFERDGILDRGSDIMDTMTDAMRDDVQRLAPLVSEYLASLKGDQGHVIQRENRKVSA